MLVDIAVLLQSSGAPTALNVYDEASTACALAYWTDSRTWVAPTVRFLGSRRESVSVPWFPRHRRVPFLSVKVAPVYSGATSLNDD